jgi:hypothetical protein
VRDLLPIATEIQSIGQLPALLDRASRTLAGARTAAEILEAREMASFVYDVAKKRARLAKAKKAHDDVIGAVYRAQADALEIEAQAKRRLADEYDAAQERGEVAKGSVRTDIVPVGNDVRPATAADLGLSRKDIHEARQIRDAESAHPGIVREALDAELAAGEEPTRAAVRAFVQEALAGHGRREYVDDPAFQAMAKLTGCCQTIIDLRAETSVETIFAGFLGSEDIRARNLRTIRKCRDLLTELLEDTDES